MRRLAAGFALALVAAVGVVAASDAAAQAHDTDDWVAAPNGPPSGATCRAAYGGDNGRGISAATVCWIGYKVYLYAFADDRTGGAPCVTARIRYIIDANSDGNWADHYHYRNPVRDCTDDGDAVIGGWWRARYDTKDLQARTCTWLDNDVFDCTPYVWPSL